MTITPEEAEAIARLHDLLEPAHVALTQYLLDADEHDPSLDVIAMSIDRINAARRVLSDTFDVRRIRMKAILRDARPEMDDKWLDDAVERLIEAAGL